MKRNSRCSSIALALLLCSTVHTAQATPISGTYVGTFVSPVPSVPPAVVAGLGTGTVNWGIPCDGFSNCRKSPGGITPPSSFTFTAEPFVTEIGIPFVLGTVRFYNGTVQPGTALDQVTLFLDGSGIAPTEYGGSESRVISIVNTPNTGDPIASADRATIPMAFFPSAVEFGVFESQSAIATLLGEFKQVAPNRLDVDILGFGKVTSGGGFIDGYAPAPVPEPSVLALLSVGLLGLAATRPRRRVL